MTSATSTPDRSRPCTEARERMHAALDGDALDAAAHQALAAHLGTCVACREAQRDLQQIQAALRGMPELKLPQADLDAVLARTSRAPRSSRLLRFVPASASGAGLAWRSAAAAALLAAGLWSVWPTAPGGPDQAAVDQAAAEARLVLTITAQALSRTQRAAIQGVMTHEVSPALNRIPMKLPPTPHEKEL